MWSTIEDTVIFETEIQDHNYVIFPELPMRFRDYLKLVGIREPLAHPSIDKYTINIAARASYNPFGLKKKGKKKKQFFGIMRSRTSFSTEVRAHQRLDQYKCPYIIKLYEHIKLSEEAGLLVTPFCNLFDFNILRPFAKLITYQLLQALKVCHDNKVVHRDIKPDNIVWKWDDDKPHIYLTDFGISLDLEYRGYDAGILGGTPCYMAPEIFFMYAANDFKPSDVWGTGLILAEMLLNKPRMLEEDRKLKKWKKHKEEWLQDDPKAFNLLTKMLTEEPSERILVDDALAHSYFDEVREKAQQSDKKRKYDCIDEASVNSPYCQQKKIKTNKQ